MSVKGCNGGLIGHIGASTVYDGDTGNDLRLILNRRSTALPFPRNFALKFPWIFALISQLGFSFCLMYYILKISQKKINSSTRYFCFEVWFRL